MQPPVLPEVTLARVLRMAKLDGTSVLALAGSFAVALAATGDRGGALIGLIISAAGAIELHGAALLRRGDLSGLRWLIGSQLYLLIAILSYVALRLTGYDPALINLIMTDSLRQRYLDAGLLNEEIDRVVQFSYYATYLLFGALTVVYQGGMMLYYSRRRSAVTTALTDQDT